MGKFPPMNESPDDLLPIRDVAVLLGVTTKTVRRWEAAGKISATRSPGGQRRFRRSEIDKIRGFVNPHREK
jgi:excisionase family DNA binding protein